MLTLYVAKPYTVNECSVPQYWGINFQPPDLGNSAPPFIGANMNIRVDGGGFCETLLTSMGAVAGKCLTPTEAPNRKG